MASKFEFESKKMEPRCYESHPTLNIGKGLLRGGSASWPVSKKADIYVSLQRGSTSSLSTAPFDDVEEPVLEVFFNISDQHAPEDVKRFKKMVTWLCNQLQAGKKVHIGCVGGHGRTGTVIAAIMAEMGEKDPIGWVREHYCPKAVESSEQVQFLVKHYGAKKAKSRHSSHSSGTLFNMGSSKGSEVLSSSDWFGRRDNPSFKPKVSAKCYAPMSSARCIWGRK